MGRLVFLKILGGIAILMMLSLGAAVLLIQHAPVVENEREPASIPDERILVDQGEVSVNDVFVKTAISDVVRARKVVFNSFELGRVLESGKTLSLELFPDKSVRIQLQDLSKYRVNDHLLVGQIAGDSRSKVRIQLAGDLVDADIQGLQGQFRIVPMGGGVHWVVETKTKTAK